MKVRLTTSNKTFLLSNRYVLDKVETTEGEKINRAQCRFTEVTIGRKQQIDVNLSTDKKNRGT